MSTQFLLKQYYTCRHRRQLQRPINWFHVQNWTTRSTQSEVFHLEGTKVNMDETRCLDPQREVPTNREAEAPVSSERFRSVRHKQASAGEGVKRTPKRHVYCMGKPMYINQAFSFELALFLGSNTAWMLGSTPPSAMVTPARSLLSSSSFLSEQVQTLYLVTKYLYLMASCRCLGMILVFLLSLAAFPASSRISAARYSMTGAK